MKTIAKIVLPLLMISQSSSAIVMRHDKSSEAYQVAYEQYPSVINLDFLMGTLIAPQWIVTAAHGTPLMPGGQQLTINGEQYRVENIVVHPDYAPESPKFQQDHDIALLKLDKPVKGVRPAGLYSKNDEVTNNVWFVGEGLVGNGRDGLTGEPEGLNHAQNLVDKTDEKWLYFDFDAPGQDALSLEGVSGPGDSGGPAFIKNSSGLLLAGVSSNQLDNDDGEVNVYGVIERYTRVSTHISWITNTMNKSNRQLQEVALDRPIYQEVAASKQELQELSGEYQVEGLPTFVVQPCDDTLCYQWQGQPRTTELRKADNDTWFTPSLNRTIEVVRNDVGKIAKLLFKGYQGGKTAIRQ